MLPRLPNGSVSPDILQVYWDRLCSAIEAKDVTDAEAVQGIRKALQDAGIALSAAYQRMPPPPPLVLDVPADLPAAVQFTRYEGGDDVTLNSEWSMTVESGTITASIGTSTGILTVTALSADAVLNIVSIRDGVPLTALYQVSIRAADGVELQSYTVGTLPAAGTAGGMIYVSDEVGGGVPAFSDGTNWRRFTDRAVVA